MAEDRPQRPYPPRDRFGAPGGGRPPAGPRPGFPPRAPFSPRPPAATPETSSIRLRDGERELEVHGSPPFCRQVVDDLPVLLARLRGEASGPGATRPAIALPAPAAPDAPGPAATRGPGAIAHATEPVASEANGHTSPGDRAAVSSPPDALDSAVIDVVRRAGRPIGIADIRARLDEKVSGQAVRRVLERNQQRVVSNGERPAAYRIR